MIILQQICILLAFLWILLQKINIRIILSENTEITINLPILSIAFITDKKQKSVIKRNLKLVKNLSVLLKSFKFILKKSQVYVNILQSSNQSFITQRIPFFVTFPIAYAYLNNTAKSVYYSNKKSYNGAFFDISFHFTLIFMIILPLVFLYYKVKNKVGRVIKNV